MTRARSLALAWATLAAVTATLLAGFFLHPGSLGAHDWDQMESHRLFVVKAIREYGRFPFWDPYGCGGFPAWGSPESATIVASPLLPVYLALPLDAAVRVEVVAFVVALVAGCWFFARGYLDQPLALAFACLVGALNSRTAAQAAVGHTWHLAYAGLPWVLGAYDRAARGRGWLAVAAAVLALMVYAGGVYPAPHAALALLLVAAYRARAARSWAPLRDALAVAGWAALLAAPKLLPVADTMLRFPRAVRSRETVPPLQWLEMFVTPAASAPDHRAAGLDYLWHEYGQYVGVVPLAVLLWGALRRPPDPRARSLRFAGATLLLLALGGWGPWLLVHLLPIFRSQRAPMRFTYPAGMLLAVVAAGAAERLGLRLRASLADRRARAWLGVLAWAAFLASAALVAREDLRVTAPWFALRVPSAVAAGAAGEFRQFAGVPPEYAYGDGDAESPGGINGPPGLLLRRANLGSVQCSGSPGMNQDAPRAADGRPLHQGARGEGDPLYRGEAWVEPRGRASIVRWAPGEVAVAVEDAAPGAFVMLDQNWDPGWTANGRPALDRGDVNGYALGGPAETVVFRYRPRTLDFGLGLFAGGVALFGVLSARGRRTGSRRA